MEVEESTGYENLQKISEHSPNITRKLTEANSFLD